jgi:polysaccharide deacetylase family protein (PEP-CTERM system associated)
MLDRHNVNATFFVLGWVAERVPELIREIEDRGHEIASHGYGHHLLTHLTPEEFEVDLRRSIKVLKDIGVNYQPIGFRAPSFTVVEKTMWALSILSKHGILYDSSVFPIGFHPDYGVPSSPLAPYQISRELTEFPLSCAEYMGKRIPCSGGGYFRLLPYTLTRLLIRKVNSDGRPAVFYLHPWELDPGQPRIPLPFTKRLRHYNGLQKTEEKLERLLNDFQFTTIREVLGV